jgi:hypothetical protein
MIQTCESCSKNTDEIYRHGDGPLLCKECVFKNDEFYYYLRDSEKRPVVTVALKKTGGTYARGIAICSNSDNPSKKTGRKIARGRAMAAIKRGMSAMPIRREEAVGILYGSDGIYEKSQYGVNPNKHERDIINRRQMLGGDK